MAQLAALLKPPEKTELTPLLRKEFAASSSPTSGLTAYGNTEPEKKRKRVRLKPGTVLRGLVSREAGWAVAS